MRPLTLRVTVAVAVAALAAVLLPSRAPVVSALTGEPLPGVRLEHPVGYLLLAPAFGIMDFLTVLTVEQHVQVFAMIFLAYVAWRSVRRRKTLGAGRRVLVESGVLIGFVLALAAFYAAGVLAYRPMARLVVEDPDVVVVDFHSHTVASHDGRWDFSIDRNRAWHRGAGNHVAFVADHDSVGPALRAAEQNPARAGDGTVILPAREVRYRRQHVVALGLADPRADSGSWVPDPDDPLGRWCAGWPVLIQTIPNDLGRVPLPGCTPGGAGVDAIELLDGDPRGLGQSDRERARILAIADSLDLVMVSASNLHGWGSTAASWNLIRIPGWREMAPEDVGARIERMLRHERPAPIEVAAYRRPPMAADGPVAAALSAVGLPLHFAALRSPAERVAWLVWLGIALLGVWRVRERRIARG